MNTKRLYPAILNLLLTLFCLLTNSCGDVLKEPVLYSQDTPLDIPLVNAELKLINYLGNTENIHPKVLYFEDGWNGFRFWMSYTPYPEGETSKENPCIAVSNDGITWGTPLSSMNPLAKMPKHGYNSDTHLVYDPESDSLECWWRVVDTSGIDTDAFLRRVSYDGMTWSESEIVYDFNEDHRCRLSPAVNIVDDKYYMVFSDCARLYQVWGTRLSTGGIEWSEPQLIDVPFDGNTLNLWHQDMIIDDNYNVEMLVCAFDRSKGENNNSADLYLLRFNIYDPSSITSPILIRQRSPYLHSITNRSIYRSSLVKAKGKYLVYISSIDHSWHRHMMLSTGYNLLDLIELSL